VQPAWVALKVGSGNYKPDAFEWEVLKDKKPFAWLKELREGSDFGSLFDARTAAQCNAKMYCVEKDAAERAVEKEDFATLDALEADAEREDRARPLAGRRTIGELALEMGVDSTHALLLRVVLHAATGGERPCITHCSAPCVKGCAAHRHFHYMCPPYCDAGAASASSSAAGERSPLRLHVLASIIGPHSLPSTCLPTSPMLFRCARAGGAASGGSGTGERLCRRLHRPLRSCTCLLSRCPGGCFPRLRCRWCG